MALPFGWCKCFITLVCIIITVCIIISVRIYIAPVVRCICNEFRVWIFFPIPYASEGIVFTEANMGS